MHLPRAYRSLARPSSALEPSHPPDSITPVTPNQVQLAFNIQHLYMTSCTCASAQAIRPSPKIYFPGALENEMVEVLSVYRHLGGGFFMLRR